MFPPNQGPNHRVDVFQRLFRAPPPPRPRLPMPPLGILRPLNQVRLNPRVQSPPFMRRPLLGEPPNAPLPRLLEPRPPPPDPVAKAAANERVRQAMEHLVFVWIIRQGCIQDKFFLKFVLFLKKSPPNPKFKLRLLPPFLNIAECIRFFEYILFLELVDNATSSRFLYILE